MSKKLPYFRFHISEWMNDDISTESYKTKGVFMDICAFYWFKDCIIDRKSLKKRFKGCNLSIEKLIELDIIKYNEETGSINILFLDDQYDMLSDKRQKRVDSGRLGGLATQRQRSSNTSSDA